MLERLQQLIGWKESYSFITEKINKEFNLTLTVDEIKGLVKSFKQGKTIQASKEEGFKIVGEKNSYLKGESEYTVESIKPLTQEQLEILLRIDKTKSFIKMTWLKSHKGGKWTYSILVMNKAPHEQSVDQFTKFLNSYSKNFVKPKLDTNFLQSEYDNKHVAVISLTDFHLDKLTLTEESLADKIKLYRTTLSTLIYRAYKSFGIDKIIFVIGNDFFHTDNFHGQTTNGTPQDIQTSWFNAYEEGFKLLDWAIDFLHGFAPVHVVHVMSNHDRVKGYYLAHALEVLYQDTPTVTFDRASSHTKVVTYGNNFFGFHHGDTEVTKLPLYFASKYGQDWGLTKYRNILLGDKHHKKQYKFNISNQEIEGVRVNFLPSLSATDKWHELKGFDLAIRSGIVYLYDLEKGYVAEFEHKIDR